MDSVHSAGWSDAAGIEEMAGKIRADLAIDIGESDAPLVRTIEFGRDYALRVANRGRSDQQNRGNRHAWLNGCFANFPDQRGDALSGRPGIVVRMAKLEIVGAEHQDYESQRRLRFDLLGESFDAFASGFEGVFPNGAASVEAILGDSDFLAEVVEFVFEDSGPALLKGEASTCVRDDSPG